MAVKPHSLAKGIESDIICWATRAQTVHFVKLEILQPDTPTVTARGVTFARFMFLL